MKILLKEEITATQTSFFRQFWWSPVFSFFLSASTAATYIFTAPTTCTTTIITLEPCALKY